MQTPLTMRPADTGDRRDLEALQWRASLNNPGDREALLASPDAINLPLEQIEAGQVFIAERDQDILGFAAVLDRPDGETELDGLFVEPSRWRGGVGRALINRCLEYGREHGAHALHVIGNPHAVGFYEACGFAHIGTHQTRFGVGLLMQKSIGPTAT